MCKLLAWFARIFLVVLFLFSSYLGQAFQGIFWPIVGWIFMPVTTLWCAYVWNNGDFSLWRMLIILICILIDVVAWLSDD